MLHSPEDQQTPPPLRQRAESFLKNVPEETSNLSQADLQRLLNELRVHQVELEIQNEELRRSQTDLQGARDQYQRLYEWAPVGYLTLDTRGTIRGANLTAATLIGALRGDLPGAPLSHFIVPDDQAVYYRHRRQAVEADGLQTCDLQMQRPDGTQWVAQVESRGVGDPKGQERQCFTTLSDITARKQAEHALEAGQVREAAGVAARLETLEQLRHADRLKTVGNLTSGLAHELGTPLNVVLGRADLIASGRLDPEELLKSTGVIREQVQRMTAILRQVLDFARRKSPQRTCMDLRLLAQQALEMLAPLAKEYQAELVFHASAQPVYVQIEPEQIKQVLVNLVTNAWQAMPDGGRVEIEVRPQDGRLPLGLNQSTAPYGCLTITDQGSGMHDDDLPYVFDPFFTTKDVGQGTGLGLSIIYGIVHDHEGWIEAANCPGHGACFSVYLPIKEA